MENSPWHREIVIEQRMKKSSARVFVTPSPVALIARCSQRALAICFVLIAMQAGVHGQIAVSHTFPTAIDPAAPTRITVYGDKFTKEASKDKIADPAKQDKEAPLRFWTSHPLQIQVIDLQPKQVVLQCSPPKKDCPVECGQIGMVMIGSQGMSEVIHLSVDAWPSVQESTENHSRESSQVIGRSMVVDGVSDGKLSDFFQFFAQRDERLTFEVLAQRIGSSMDPVVRLLDDQGKEVVAYDDDIVSADCRFQHQFQKSGTYCLEVYDNRYRAGGRYRLRFGTQSIVDAVYPCMHSERF